MSTALPEHPEKLRIIHYPDPRLRKVSVDVAPEEFGDLLRRLVARMLVLMREDDGVGLAAPQVGVNKRLFVMNARGENAVDRVYVNPVLSEPQGGETASEGCLSLPDISVQMTRSVVLRLQALDLDGNPVDETAEGFVARVWQHETDHLDGKLIIDSMSPTEKLANRRKIKELEGAWK